MEVFQYAVPAVDFQENHGESGEHGARPIEQTRCKGSWALFVWVV